MFVPELFITELFLTEHYYRALMTFLRGFIERHNFENLGNYPIFFLNDGPQQIPIRVSLFHRHRKFAYSCSSPLLREDAPLMWLHLSISLRATQSSGHAGYRKTRCDALLASSASCVSGLYHLHGSIMGFAELVTRPSFKLKSDMNICVLCFLLSI